MLTALHIQDFVLIEQLALDIGGGLTALTGETGAGKSILLDALGLAAGARADRGAVRAGAEQGAVTATFEVDSSHPVWKVLEDNAIASDEDIILRRVQTKDGRSKAFVNDNPVSIGLLRDIGEALIEIHGQHDGRGFLTSATHRGLLDEYGGLGAEIEAVARNWAEWKSAQAALEERRENRRTALAEADYLRHVVDELRALDPREGEESVLAARRTALQAAEKITEDLGVAASLLAEDGLEGRLAQASRRIARASAAFPAGDNPLAAASDRLEAALSEVMEARAAVDDASAHLGSDPGELERAEERLFALRAAARKHATTPDGLSQILKRAEDMLADLDAGEKNFSALETRVAKAKSAYAAAAKSLSNARRRAAADLDKAVAKELAPLKLGKAKFETSITTDEARPTSDGIDQVEFVVATNPGAPPGPLKTIASGGELSRFVLALKAALAAKENRTVIIFDEVDAGVGGAVADAVGERLARLARDAQVLVVTHSPQVAARANAHFRVSKSQSKTATKTAVEPLNAYERIEEIARMLSGAKVTDAARAAARQLLGAAEPAGRRRRKIA